MAWMVKMVDVQGVRSEESIYGATRYRDPRSETGPSSLALGFANCEAFAFAANVNATRKNVMLRHQRLPQSVRSLCWRQARNQHGATVTNAATSVNALALDGVRIGVKANIVARVSSPVPATAASKMLAGYNSSFDSTVVQLLKEQNAAIQIDRGMDEFGMGSHSQFSFPDGGVESIFSRHGLPLSPGGSSGGSAVAVAKGEVEVAVGTDTGGSVRLPAAYLGGVGFKPSYGRISRWGVVQYANSLDTVGILGRDVERVRAVWGVLDRWDRRDPTAQSRSLRERIAKSGMVREGKALRIGIPLEYNIAELSPIVRKTYLSTLRTIQGAGHILRPVSLPSTQSALSAYYVLAPAEASSNLAKYDGIRYGYRTETPDASPTSDPPLPLYAQTRGEGFGEEVKRRILLGAYTLSSEAMDNYFIQAQRVRRLVQRDFDAVFAAQNPLFDSRPGNGPPEENDKVDFLLTPTAPTLPPTIAELKQQSPLESYMNDVFTVPASLAGLPAISIPTLLPSDELAEMDDSDVKSAGMQLIGQFGQDEQVLNVAETLQNLFAEKG